MNYKTSGIEDMSHFWSLALDDEVLDRHSINCLLTEYEITGQREIETGL